MHAPPQWLLSNATHVSPLQQPLLQADCPLPHAVPHWWFVWHAVWAGQSAATLQPQVPLTHTAPLEDAVQLTHAPGEPQLVGVFAQGPGPVSAPIVSGGASSGEESARASAGTERSDAASLTGVASDVASSIASPPSLGSARPSTPRPHAATLRAAITTHARDGHAAKQRKGGLARERACGMYGV